MIIALFSRRPYTFLTGGAFYYSTSTLTDRALKAPIALFSFNQTFQIDISRRSQQFRVKSPSTEDRLFRLQDKFTSFRGKTPFQPYIGSVIAKFELTPDKERTVVLRILGFIEPPAVSPKNPAYKPEDGPIPLPVRGGILHKLNRGKRQDWKCLIDSQHDETSLALRLLADGKTSSNTEAVSLPKRLATNNLFFANQPFVLDLSDADYFFRVIRPNSTNPEDMDIHRFDLRKHFSLWKDNRHTQPFTGKVLARFELLPAQEERTMVLRILKFIISPAVSPLYPDYDPREGVLPLPIKGELSARTKNSSREIWKCRIDSRHSLRYEGFRALASLPTKDVDHGSYIPHQGTQIVLKDTPSTDEIAQAKSSRPTINLFSLEQTFTLNFSRDSQHFRVHFLNTASEHSIHCFRVKNWFSNGSGIQPYNGKVTAQFELTQRTVVLRLIKFVIPPCLSSACPGYEPATGRVPLPVEGALWSKRNMRSGLTELWRAQIDDTDTEIDVGLRLLVQNPPGFSTIQWALDQKKQKQSKTPSSILRHNVISTLTEPFQISFDKALLTVQVVFQATSIPLHFPKIFEDSRNGCIRPFNGTGTARFDLEAGTRNLRLRILTVNSDFSVDAGYDGDLALPVAGELARTVTGEPWKLNLQRDTSVRASRNVQVMGLLADGYEAYMREQKKWNVGNIDEALGRSVTLDELLHKPELVRSMLYPQTVNEDELS